jgi:GDPmannose 4,6-dehydratase
MRIDPRYFRPAEVETLLGDLSKAKALLGWPQEISAQEMCAEMILGDLKSARKLSIFKKYGYDVPVAIES